MPLSTATLNSRSTDLFTNYWKFCALATGTPTASTAGTELSGGSYARVAMTNGTPSGGVNVTSAVTINVPASTTPNNVEGYSAITAGTYAGWVGFTGIPFSVAGTLQVTITDTET